MKYILASIIVFGSLTVLSGCTLLSEEPSSDSDAITVATTFYVLEHFVDQVGGDAVELITPPQGSGSHSYAPTPQVVADIYSADVLVYQGGNFDPWVKDLIPDLEAQGTTVIQIMDSLESQTADPHTWLDPMLATEMVEVIEVGLSEVDPDNSASYKMNAEQYITELEELHTTFEVGLAQCNLDTIVVAHDAFGRMAEQYNFSVESIAGFSPDVKPSAKRLAELTEVISEINIDYIFFEELTSPELSESLAADTGVETLVLNPLEALSEDDLAAGREYISVMEDNLSNLQTALDCN